MLRRLLPHEAFYATAAQVIPVLILVLALEARLISHGDKWNTRVAEVLRLSAIGIALFTEAMTVALLARGADSFLARVVIYVGFSYLLLVILGLSLNLSPTFASTKEGKDGKKDSKS
jgi:hypothetical protein